MSSHGDSLDLDERLGVDERLHFHHGHGGIMAAHMFAVNLAERGAVGEVRRAIRQIDDHPADILWLPARRAHDFHHAAQCAVPLLDEIADGDDLAGDKQHRPAFLAQHPMIPAARPSPKDFRIDDLERHAWFPQPAIVTAVPLGRLPLRSQRARTASATSSGVISRRCDADASIAESAASAAFPVFATTRSTDSLVISVSTNPGHTALHVTPVPSTSAATLSVKPITACLAAA